MIITKMQDADCWYWRVRHYVGNLRLTAEGYASTRDKAREAAKLHKDCLLEHAAKKIEND